MDELTTLRVSVARIAQALGIESEIPGGPSEDHLPFEELVRRARECPRGWNRLCAFIVDGIENPSLKWLDDKLAEFP